MSTSYTVQIRRTDGHGLAYGRGHSDWQRTLLRLARTAGIARSTDQIGTDTYFPTTAGRPSGTHHVQFGHTPRGARSGLTLGSVYVVSVQPG